MSTDNKIKCIQCGSLDTYIFLGNKDPNKFGYRYRNCGKSWRKHMVRTIPTQTDRLTILITSYDD